MANVEAYSAYEEDLGLGTEVFQMIIPIQFRGVDSNWAVATAVPKSVINNALAATEEVSSTATVQLQEVDTIRQYLHQLEDISTQLNNLMFTFKVKS